MQDCLNYFREKTVFLKLLEGFRDKYLSLGYAGGRVVLKDLSLWEIEDLEGFLGGNYHGRKSINIPATLFEEALSHSKFSGITLDMLLKSYYGKLLSKEETHKNYLRDREHFFQNLLSDYKETPGGGWLGKVLEYRFNPYVSLMQRYNRDKCELENLLKAVMEGLNKLPVYNGNMEKIPVFATRITGNPHFFDERGAGYPLLKAGIAFLLKKEEEESEVTLYQSEKSTKLLYEAGLLKDDLSNYTVAYGIQAWREKDILHKGIQGFYEEQEPVQISLYTLSDIRHVTIIGEFVYVVENPAVFSAIFSKSKEISVVCTNGQLKLASLLLLDKLAEGGAHIMYAGDFDPEGIQIADRLKQRYKGGLSFWRMTCEDYERAVSSVRLNEKRLKILDKIGDKDLQTLADAMRKRQTAGYQENILDHYYRNLANMPE